MTEKTSLAVERDPSITKVTKEWITRMLKLEPMSEGKESANPEPPEQRDEQEQQKGH